MPKSITRTARRQGRAQQTANDFHTKAIVAKKDVADAGDQDRRLVATGSLAFFRLR